MTLNYRTSAGIGAAVGVAGALMALGLILLAGWVRQPERHFRAAPANVEGPPPITAPVATVPTVPIDHGPSAGWLALALLVVYFLPWFVARGREHRNRGAIAMLNLLLGWTLIGWAGAMIWACTENTRKGSA